MPQGLGIIVLLAGSAVVAPAVFSDGGWWPTVLWTAAGLGAARELDAHATSLRAGTGAGPAASTSTSAVAGTDAILARSQALRDLL